LVQRKTHIINMSSAIETFLLSITPFQEDFGPHVIWSQSFKPEFYALHRKVGFYLSHLNLTTLMIVPLWALSVGQSSYFVFDPDTACLKHIDGHTRCAHGYLSEAATDGGWELTPIQGHAHRYGLGYTIMIYMHIILGLLLTAASVISAVYFAMARCCTDNKLLRLFAEVVHYYFFMWAWVLNITIATAMAYVRFITMGSTPSNWAGSFSMSFFITFYFVVIAQIINLQVLFFDESSAYNTDWDIFFFRRTLYAGQAMFAIAITLVGILVLDPSQKKALGFEDTSDVAVFAAISLFFVPPILATFLEIDGFKLVSKIICGSTASFITALIMAINITYHSGGGATGPVAIVIVIIYVIFVVWRIVVEKGFEHLPPAGQGFVELPETESKFATHQKGQE